MRALRAPLIPYFVRAVVLVIVETAIAYGDTDDVAMALRAFLIWSFCMAAWLLWMRRKRGD